MARVKLAITDSGFCVATSNKFTVAIYSDACTNTPGTRIGSAVVATAPAAPCALANANFAGAGVALTAGTKYWVVVTTSGANAQKGTTAVWWMANSAYAPYNLNDGNGWINFPDGARAVSKSSNKRHRSNIESSSRRYFARARSFCAITAARARLKL